MPAGKLVPPLDGAGEYNGDGPTPLSAITKGPEPPPSKGPGASSIRGGYLPSTDELDPSPPYSSSQPSFSPPTLARSIYNCSRCHQPFETGGVLRRSAQRCVGPEIAGRPLKCDKCSYTLDKGDLLELHSQKCVGHGGAFKNIGPFRPKPNITRIMEKMGDPKKVWCLTYIDCSGDEDGEIREEYKSRLKRGMIESSRLGLWIGGIFGPWQNEV